MDKSIGLLETKGLVAAIGAANEMIKSAEVKLTGIEKLKNGFVTVTISGKPDSVQQALNRGVETAKSIGELISSHIIISPDNSLSLILPELESSGDDIQLPEVEPEKVPPKRKPKKTRTEKKIKQESLKETADILPEQEPPIKEEEPEKPIVDEPKIEKVEEEKREKEIDSEIVEKSVEEESEPKDENLEIEVIVEETPGTKPVEAVVQEPVEKKIPKAKPVVKSSPLTGNETIDRLRREALGIKEPSETVQNENVDSDKLESLNVHELRKLARSVEDFPIKGREISKANRNTLLDYFRNIGE